MFLKKVLMLPLFLTTLVEVHALTLSEALVLTLENDPIAVERIKNYNAAREDVKIAQAGYYPSVDLHAGIGYQDISNSDTGFNKSAESIYESSLVLSQNLFNGFSTTYRIAMQEARMMAAAYSFVEKANASAYALVDNYLKVLKERELMQIAELNIKHNERILEQIVSLYNAKIRPFSQQQKIKSSLSLARSNYFVSKNNYKDAQHRLKKLMGWYVDSETIQLPDSNIKLPKKRDDALQFAMQNNPLIRVANYKLKEAQEDYKETRGEFLPKVDAQVRQTFNSNLDGIKGDEDDFRAMVTLSYNLYRGGADKANTQKRISLLNQKVAARNNLKRQVMENFDVSWNAIEELKNQLIHLEKYHLYSEKTLALYEDEYKNNECTLLDVITAHNDLIAAKKQSVNAKYNLLFAKYRVLDAMGIMVEEILGDAQSFYSKVGIGSNGIVSDALPISLDDDNDQYSDNQDICHNTASQNIANMYGCQARDETVQRYSGFTSSYSGVELDAPSRERLDRLIFDLKRLEDVNQTINVIAHSSKLGNAKKEAKLTQEMSEWVKEYMVKRGIEAKQIATIAKGANEPLWVSDGFLSLSENNRVDIVIITPIVATQTKDELTPNVMQSDTPSEVVAEAVVEKQEKVVIAPVVESTPEIITKPVLIEVAQKPADTAIVMHGHIVILGSFLTAEAAERFASQFIDINNATMIVEFAKNRYNLKLVSKSRSKSQEVLKKVKTIVPDAWYAGKQNIRLYKVL